MNPIGERIWFVGASGDINALRATKFRKKRRCSVLNDRSVSAHYVEVSSRARLSSGAS